MPICRYFIQGKCKYGAQCVNEHPRGSHPTAISSAQYTTPAPQHQQLPGPSKPKQQQQQDQYRQHTQRDQGTSNIRQPLPDDPHRGHYNERGVFSHQPSNKPIPSPHRQQSQHYQQQSHASNIRPEDVIIHDLTAVNIQWPLGCYGLNVSWEQGDNIIKGDYSPEELRCEAYAQISTRGDISAYQTTLAQVLNERRHLIEQFKANPQRALAVARVPRTISSQMPPPNSHVGIQPQPTTHLSTSASMPSMTHISHATPIDSASQSSLPSASQVQSLSQSGFGLTPMATATNDTDYDSFTFGNIPELPPP